MNRQVDTTVNDNSQAVLGHTLQGGVPRDFDRASTDLDDQVNETVRLALDHLYGMPKSERGHVSVMACLARARIELEERGLAADLRAPAQAMACEILHDYVAGCEVDSDVLVMRHPIGMSAEDQCVWLSCEIDRVDFAEDGESVVLTNYCFDDTPASSLANDPLLLMYVAAAEDALGRPVKAVRRIMLRERAVELIEVRPGDSAIAARFLARCVDAASQGAEFQCFSDGSLVASPLAA